MIELFHGKSFKHLELVIDAENCNVGKDDVGDLHESVVE